MKLIIFDDYPDFKPNLTPQEILKAGAFGGTYFRPIFSTITGKEYNFVYKELPTKWLKDLDISKQVASSVYRKEVNKYGVKCGSSLETWEESGWITKQDPYGWFQWYCRFFQGRRTKDDIRQIDRWKKFTGEKGRWKMYLMRKIYISGKKYNDISISPVVRQSLLHWAYNLSKEDFDYYKKNLIN